jgi:hypothetical protein
VGVKLISDIKGIIFNNMSTRSRTTIIYFGLHEGAGLSQRMTASVPGATVMSLHKFLKDRERETIIRSIHHNNYVTVSIYNSTIILGTDHREITWLGSETFTNYICKRCEYLCPLYAKSHVLRVLTKALKDKVLLCVPMDTNTSC